MTKYSRLRKMTWRNATSETQGENGQGERKRETVRERMDKGKEKIYKTFFSL